MLSRRRVSSAAACASALNIGQALPASAMCFLPIHVYVALSMMRSASLVEYVRGEFHFRHKVCKVSLCLYNLVLFRIRVLYSQAIMMLSR